MKGLKFELKIEEKGYCSTRGMLWNIDLYRVGSGTKKVYVCGSPDYTIDQVMPALKMYDMMLKLLRTFKDS